jgi:hypothetical protein
MEDHPNFDAMLKEASAKGFSIKYGKEARVELLHVMDDTGRVLEVRRELHLIPGMRYLDLEHEMGHVRQLDRFGSTPSPTRKAILRDGKEKEAPGHLASGQLTTKMNSIVEYHNRLQEYVRLAERKAPSPLLAEHAGGLNKWRREAETAGLGYAGRLGAWAQQHFPDIPELEARCRALGIPLTPKTRRW